MSFLGNSVVKNLPANAGAAGDMIWSLGQEDFLEEEMATYTSVLAWEIQWTEEPGRLQSMGLQRVLQRGCKGVERDLASTEY